VAEFIGAPKMNIVKTDLIKENGKYFVTPFGAKIEVTGEKGAELAKRGVQPGKILLGVRPEHITLAPKGQGIPTKLEVNEMMGSELHLHVYTEDETRLIVRVPTIGLSAEQRKGMVYGAPLNITFEGKVMHFFDPKTEKNLLLD
jgi:multiple sugar transport system ATP-binding protein